jgi:methyl-accepting chemotaxis protein
MNNSTLSLGKKVGGAFAIILLFLATISMLSLAGNGSPRTIFLLAASAMVLAILLAIGIIRNLTRRIHSLTVFAETMAQGDFTASLSVNGSDELDHLGRCLCEMQSHLGSVLSDVVSGVVHLSSSSQELFGISQTMSTGATNMSDRSHTVAAAAEEMSSNMNSVAAASEEASTNISLVATAAEGLNTTVSEIARNSESARSISAEAVTTANEASDRVAELGQAAQQINTVTQVITDISEQTNLLALNATIEAARAGEAGKGFAVVANEIKELAKQTAVATQDIKTEINGIQNTTTSTVDQIQQITSVIERVNDIVSSIASAVEEQSSTTQEIATNVAQASDGIQEVNINVSQSSSVSTEIARDIAVVSQVAGEISNSSSTVSSNAGDLSSFTIQLRDKAGGFKLKVPQGQPSGSSTLDSPSVVIPDLIQWNDGIKVNVRKFDEQHKHLVALINKLHKAMKTNAVGHVLSQILSDLVEYTKVHFKTEEEAMQRYDFPEISMHQAKHQELIAHVAEVQEKLKTGNALISMEVMEFLKDWLVNHIQGTDKEYSPFFHAKGLH